MVDFSCKKINNDSNGKTPEYIIFNNHKDIVKQSFQNWLVRDYDTVVTWDTNSSIKNH